MASVSTQWRQYQHNGISINIMASVSTQWRQYQHNDVSIVSNNKRHNYDLRTDRRQRAMKNKISGLWRFCNNRCPGRLVNSIRLKDRFTPILFQLSWLLIQYRSRYNTPFYTHTHTHTNTDTPSHTRYSMEKHRNISYNSISQWVCCDRRLVVVRTCLGHGLQETGVFRCIMKSRPTKPKHQ